MCREILQPPALLSFLSKLYCTRMYTMEIIQASGGVFLTVIHIYILFKSNINQWNRRLDHEIRIFQIKIISIIFNSIFYNSDSFYISLLHEWGQWDSSERSGSDFWRKVILLRPSVTEYSFNRQKNCHLNNLRRALTLRSKVLTYYQIMMKVNKSNQIKIIPRRQSSQCAVHSL